MWELKISLSGGQSIVAQKDSPWIRYMSVHMVVPPALESRALVVSVLAVDLDQLVEDTACATKVLVTKVVSKNEKDLLKCQTIAPDKAT